MTVMVALRKSNLQGLTLLNKNKISTQILTKMAYILSLKAILIFSLPYSASCWQK